MSVVGIRSVCYWHYGASPKFFSRVLIGDGKKRSLLSRTGMFERIGGFGVTIPLDKIGQ